MYVFYKGMWPNTLAARPREPFVGGATRDAMWREVPLFQRPDEIAMPYTIKELIYEEVWKALPRQLQDDTVGGKSPEKANPGDPKKAAEP